MSFESGGTCVLAWKRREGIGGRLAPAGRKWEKRWFIMVDGQIRYYRRGDEDKFGEENFEARGAIDLLRSKCTVQVASQLSPDAPTQNEVVIVSEEAPPKERTQLPPGVTTTAAASSSTNAVYTTHKKPNITQWKLCFDTQNELVEFLEKAHAILEHTGQLEEKDDGRFEHDFMPADHIYRWEMIVCPPVIYPIQIHGIVLEAGRNCVVVADFGLTGYGKKSTDDDFHHAEDKTTQNIIIAQFKKLIPNSDQRLHITTLTDPMDIRKWHKAHYDETSFKAPETLKNLTKITKMLGKMKLSKGLKDEVVDMGLNIANSNDIVGEALEGDAAEAGGGNNEHSMLQQELEAKQKAAWEDYVKQRQEEHPLPKADPKEIVLSRANFLLEYGEERLPPYHVFFSNSECIAVWCKTGRWSTLQTAVFLSSNAIGGAKSATLATLGVAAAHAILAPVVAVGGLIWVSAPMVILKKSREKWEENTRKMTDLYWSWAPPSIFVCAIEHWSELGYGSDKNKTIAGEKKQNIFAKEKENDGSDSTGEKTMEQKVGGKADKKNGKVESGDEKEIMEDVCL